MPTTKLVKKKKDGDTKTKKEEPKKEVEIAPGPRRIDASTEMTWGVTAEYKCGKAEIQKCQHCREQVTYYSTCLRAFGNIWHAKCLKCDLCGKKIEEGKFPKVVGQKFCSESCARKVEQDQPKEAGKICKGCDKALGLQFMEVGDDKYHNQCFACYKCKKRLRGDYI